MGDQIGQENNHYGGKIYALLREECPILIFLRSFSVIWEMAAMLGSGVTTGLDQNVLWIYTLDSFLFQKVNLILYLNLVNGLDAVGCGDGSGEEAFFNGNRNF